METGLKRPSRQPVLIWLILSQALAVLSLFFWLMVAGLSVMAFDSGVTAQAWMFVIVVWSYPLWPIAFAIASWSWPHGYSILNVPRATVNTFALISSSVTTVLAWASLKLRLRKVPPVHERDYRALVCSS